MRTIFVFVGSGRYSVPREIGIVKRLRITLRFPSRVRRCLLAAIVRFTTRSEIAHVAFGCDGVVLETGGLGSRFWPLLAYSALNQSLLGVFELRVPVIPVLDKISLPPTRIFPSLLRLVTRGRTRADDCVCVVVRLLRVSGVLVPSAIVTPKSLVAWLHAQGYRHAAFATDKQARATDALRDP